MSRTRETRSVLEHKHREARALWLRSERDARIAKATAKAAYKALKAATRKVAK